MITKTRLTVTIDQKLVTEIDALCYPIPRSAFVNALLDEALKLLKLKQIRLDELTSPLVRRSLAAFQDAGGAGYA